MALLKKLLVFVLINLCLLINVESVSASSKKDAVFKKIMTGRVIQNEMETPAVVIFVPNSSENKDKTFEEKTAVLLSNVRLDQINDLKFADLTLPADTKKRFSTASALMMLGGLSITGNVQHSIQEGRADNRLLRNFEHPRASLKEGWKADDNMFLINYVGHPLEWFMLANYLKAAGATDREAIIISQFVNIAWEFVAEGNYVPPSPKDLASNTLGSLAGVYLYNIALKKPIDATYGKLSRFSQAYGVDLEPQFRYNSKSRGMIFGAIVKVKK